jgi:dienelactone hydrolase
MAGPGAGTPRATGAALRGQEAPRPRPRTGYFRATYRSALDDSEQPFALWVPRSYSPRRAYPLVVALHGTDADERMIPEECFRMHERGFREEVIFLSPFGRGDLFWQGPGEADLWETIQWVKQRYRIDARRQYLTGLSMGGFGTWRLACAYPDQWAAIAPVCGGGDPEALRALRRIPVWCVHGRKDPVVSVTQSRRLIAELQRWNGRYRYDELPGWRHNAWEWLYDPNRRPDGLVDWFLQFRKARPAPAIQSPRRRGGFADLFGERVIVSHPASSSIPREVELLQAEAESFAAFRFGDLVMRRGRLLTKTDAELTPADLKSANHLMIGRTDNHRWLKAAERRLLARHHQGVLHLRGQTFIGKTLVAATCQPSPWNPTRLLGVVTYQQCRQVRGIAEALCGLGAAPLAVNLYDAQQKRFILREPGEP